MSLFVTSLNSGSNGNCYYIGNHNEAVLVDVGLSCREVEKRMKRLQLQPEKLKAIFISHEHSDHVRGLSIFSKKYQLPVYITAPTLSNGRIALQQHLVHSFTAAQPVSIGALTITPFAKCHDACDPFSFSIACNNVSVGVFTDIGTPCDQLRLHFKQCHAAFLEANYDEEMLEKGNYPYHLKSRIRSGNGHLSNRQALQVFLSCKPSFMTHLFLAHLSNNNNCPKLVAELFTRHAKGVQVVVASRFNETPLYHITGQNTTHVSTHTSTSRSAQLAFSFAQ